MEFKEQAIQIMRAITDPQGLVPLQTGIVSLPNITSLLFLFNFSSSASAFLSIFKAIYYHGHYMCIQSSLQEFL